MRFLTVVLIVLVALGLGWAWLFGPYWIDSYKMEDVVGSAALSWSAYGEARGHLELADGLRKRGIPDYLTPDACRFYEESGGLKTVDCAWTADVYIPVVASTRRLHFQVTKTAATDGRLLE